jgi:1,2-diacylglycerol 3-alpha-glucosyltransferase
MFTETWLPNRDGVVTSLLSFRRGLEALGHEVFIFAAGSDKARQAGGDNNVYIYTGPTWTPYPDYRIALKPGPTRRLLGRLGVDLIHSHGTAFMGLKAVRCARLQDLPLLLTFHTRVEDATGYVTQHPAREAVLKGLIWRWHRWYFNQCDGIVTPTQTVKRDLLREAPDGIRRVFVVPTGIDVDRFAVGDGRAFRARHGLEGKRIVATVGRVAWEKNLDTLIDACSRLRSTGEDLTFVVAGKGPALDHFKAEVARRQLEESIRFLGFVPDEELPSLYQAADAFLMTSTFETQGIALLEAMSAGVPVVAADLGGPTEFVRSSQNGFLFEGRNPESCCNALQAALVASPELRANARQTAKAYTTESQARALLSAYTEVLDARRPA